MTTEIVHTVVVEDYNDIPEPYLGWLTALLHDGMFGARAGIRVGHTEAELEMFLDWIMIRVTRLLKPDGSEPDEWCPGPDGHLYAWARPVTLPGRGLATATDRAEHGATAAEQHQGQHAQQAEDHQYDGDGDARDPPGVPWLLCHVVHRGGPSA